ncbi:hypothetical protein GUJ93_ZPchr0009g1861 [Zizania palustris]|uniref:Uncharacterized protein n=1 Tax=Zizania palustris TaxID=103762 RepID=A0A8J5VKS6_ZIZPA|nr:hypothetical protein GUJ93_ZPchr0009g1861 [Zizania palustris]
MGAADGPALSWRAVAAAGVALCALPVVVSLAVLWLPLVCCAVAAVRFRRVRMRRRTVRRSCCGVGGGRQEEKGEEDGDDRRQLLQKYLEDQMELVGADAGEFSDPPRES